MPNQTCQRLFILGLWLGIFGHTCIGFSPGAARFYYFGIAAACASTGVWLPSWHYRVWAGVLTAWYLFVVILDWTGRL